MVTILKLDFVLRHDLNSPCSSAKYYLFISQYQKYHNTLYLSLQNFAYALNSLGLEYQFFSSKEDIHEFISGST